MDQHKPLGPSDQDQKTDVESFQVCWNYLGACSKRQETIPFTNNWARLERVGEFGTQCGSSRRVVWLKQCKSRRCCEVKLSPSKVSNDTLTIS